MAAALTTWELYDNSVYIRTGTLGRNDVAAFDFDNTLVWSDSGLIFMRTDRDWVPTVNRSKLIEFFRTLVDPNWTIAIFNNSLETNPEFSQNVLRRIDNFITQVQNDIPSFQPYVFVSIRKDIYRKPNVGMWDLFRNMTNIEPSPASFYCGDAAGMTNANPLYRWSREDEMFASANRLEYYTPDQMIGTFSLGTEILPHTPLIIMASHPSQYEDFVNDLITTNPQYVRSSLKEARKELKKGNIPIIAGERLATLLGRQRLVPYLPRTKIQGQILLFTRPIRPFVTQLMYDAADAAIRGYANALDFHPRMEEDVIEGSFKITRVN